jgi:hypothetical protein
LFITYINDIISSSRILHFILFADDTNLFHSANNVDALLRDVNCELQKLCNWFKANKLSLNAEKTKFILFGRKGRKVNMNTFCVTIDNNKIERVSSTKFLGVYIDDNLDWKHQISQVAVKVSKSLGLLNRVKFVLSKKSLKMFYNTFILPHFLYCNIIWGCANESTLTKLVVLQKRAVRIINHSQYRDPTKPIFKSLQILKLPDIHRAQVLFFMFKAKNNLLPESCRHHIKKITSGSRYSFRYKSEFCVPAFRTIVRQNYIAVEGPKLWEILPENIRPNYFVFYFQKKSHELVH